MPDTTGMNYAALISPARPPALRRLTTATAPSPTPSRSVTTPCGPIRQPVTAGDFVSLAAPGHSRHPADYCYMIDMVNGLCRHQRRYPVLDATGNQRFADGNVVAR